MGTQIFEKLENLDRLEQSPIFVFAADPLASVGLQGLGYVQDPKPHHRTRPEFLQLQRDLVAAGSIDGLLMTPADAEVLALDEGLFDNTHVTPIVRMNSETAIWNPRFGVYGSQHSMPFQTVFPEDTRGYCEALIAPALECRIGLGLYSITLNNDVQADLRMLSTYIQFAHTVGEMEGFDHILEVFLPNVKLPGMDEEKRGMYVADSIVRTMSYLRKHQRPRFIKTAYTTPQVWQELTQFDPTIVIGALGGPRQNARRTLQLAHDVVRYGGRAILFGRSIFGEVDPVGIARALRSVLDKEINPEEARSEFQKSLRKNERW
jgi:hypothetical protein